MTYAIKLGADNVDLKCKTTYWGRGLDLTDCEMSNSSNGFAIGSYFEISYLGLIMLRSQTVFYSDEIANDIVELKEIIKFPWELINTEAAGEYAFQGSFGLEQHPAVLKKVRHTIRAKQVVPAMQVFSTLSGDAIEIDTEEINTNNILAQKDVRYYLVDYGVSLRVSVQTATSNDIYTVKNIEID